MIVSALKWIGGIDGCLEIVDQRRLPGEFVKMRCREVEQLCEAIRTLAVRGAPAIGVAGGYGLVLSLQKAGGDDLKAGLRHLKEARELLASSRPTGANLFWALRRIEQRAEAFAAENRGAGLNDLREAVLAEANAICEEDIEMCRRIGENGERFIKDGAGVLTHCNAGALATAGQGTALSVIFEANKRGKKFRVYVDETRPLLQGGRLTAWELRQAGIEVTVICDNMAGWLMKQGRVGVVITGADRIAANGDAANKIGTYSLSILAKEHGVPFYIAAPSSTFDLSIKSGAEIPIEQRSAEELRFFGGAKITPDNVEVWNPAFDVTEAKNITAIITERGVIEKPDASKTARHLA
jgi:methylthioribose-1-phosphate isomerase